MLSECPFHLRRQEHSRDLRLCVAARRASGRRQVAMTALVSLAGPTRAWTVAAYFRHWSLVGLWWLRVNQEAVRFSKRARLNVRCPTANGQTEACEPRRVPKHHGAPSALVELRPIAFTVLSRNLDLAISRSIAKRAAPAADEREAIRFRALVGHNVQRYSIIGGNRRSKMG